jgi:hypothetical protein
LMDFYESVRTGDEEQVILTPKKAAGR